MEKEENISAALKMTVWAEWEYIASRMYVYVQFEFIVIRAIITSHFSYKFHLCVLYYMYQGDRYEGFFINNKFDGQGSYYERDAISGKVTATHGSWQVSTSSLLIPKRILYLSFVL